MAAMADWGTCSVCMEEYDVSHRVPKLLSCGHSFCSHCLLGHNLITTKCRRPIGNRRKLPNDLTMMDYLEQKMHAERICHQNAEQKTELEDLQCQVETKLNKAKEMSAYFASDPDRIAKEIETGFQAKIDLLVTAAKSDLNEADQIKTAIQNHVKELTKFADIAENQKSVIQQQLKQTNTMKENHDQCEKPCKELLDSTILEVNSLKDSLWPSYFSLFQANLQTSVSNLSVKTSSDNLPVNDMDCASPSKPMQQELEPTVPKLFTAVSPSINADKKNENTATNSPEITAPSSPQAAPSSIQAVPTSIQAVLSYLQAAPSSIQVAPSSAALVPSQPVDPVLENYRKKIKPKKTFGRHGDNFGQFKEPNGISVFPNGEVLVSEFEGNRVQILSHLGWSRLRMGMGILNHPMGTAVTKNGDIIVCDTGNNCLRIYDTEEGELLKTFDNPQFDVVWDVAVDANDGWIFVVEYNEKTSRHCVTVYNEDYFFRLKFGQRFLTRPHSIAVRGANIAVSDTSKSCCAIFENDGSFGFRHYIGSDVLELPRGVALDSKGNVLVSDCAMKQVIIMDIKGKVLHTILEWRPAPAMHPYRSSKPIAPDSICVNDSGDIYVTDAEHHRVYIF